MANSWIIRLYKANDYSDQVDVIGDFRQYKNRQLDDIVVFSGMYGLDDYFIWYIHKNIGSYDFTTVNVDLSLYLDASSHKTFWRKQYKILDIKYDANASKYVVFGISLDSVKLKTKLVDYGVKSLSWDENRVVYKQDPTKEYMANLRKTITPEAYIKEEAKVKKSGVLYEVLEKNGIFKVEYMESVHEKDLRNFEYRMLTFDENWTVEDFINYIADQNHLEWYVRNNVLYIGNECQPIITRNATRKFDLETDNVSSTAWFKKYSGETRPMDVMSHISKVWRCVWVKHIAGASGGVSKGCFMRRGTGTLDKRSYFKTLEGDPERNIASKLFINKPYSHYITLGNILEDNGEIDVIDKVSVQKNKELYKINQPPEIKFDRGDEAKSPVFQIKERIARSTPYLDHNAGLMFPSSVLEDDEGNPVIPPNSVIFNVEGKEESSVVGPFVYGNRKVDFTVPLKMKKDFRLSFPNGWTLYVDEAGRTLLQAADRSPIQTGPFTGKDENDEYTAKATTYMYMKPAGLGGKGAAFSFNCVDGENTDESKPHGGVTVRIEENIGVGIRSKHKSNNKGINALFEKTKILHTVLEDVTDLDWDPTIGNKTRYDQENGYIKLEHQDGTLIEMVKVAENDILIRVGADGDEKIIRILDSEIDILIGNSSISLLEDEIIMESTAVNIQGGSHFVARGTHKHDLGAHTHNVTGIGVPTGPPLADLSGASDDNTTKTKVD